MTEVLSGGERPARAERVGSRTAENITRFNTFVSLHDSPLSAERVRHYCSSTLSLQSACRLAGLISDAAVECYCRVLR